jgi:hypothetical protein
MEDMDALPEAAVVPDGLIAAQLGSAELAAEVPAELPSNTPAAPVKKARRSRSTPKPTPPAETPNSKLPQG